MDLGDDRIAVEIGIIQDVIDTVERRLRAYECRGRQVVVPRSHIYAAVLQRVITSARELWYRPTLDGAEVLDQLLDDGSDSLLEDLLRDYLVSAN
ncbi:hypothetical protein [Nocardia cyriacigeorgica]|uniref:hypothetical protein n=1 Tax=Nocardia cyriacigeorgica TaxID=135487 RepID=UPI001895C152|nr:hypothetical protein [Nocardia cyriacigeorgica]MBF6413576.1 hypothetical protein [Nocardia cyriacigeorgica]